MILFGFCLNFSFIYFVHVSLQKYDLDLFYFLLLNDKYDTLYPLIVLQHESLKKYKIG